MNRLNTNGLLKIVNNICKECIIMKKGDNTVLYGKLASEDFRNLFNNDLIIENCGEDQYMVYHLSEEKCNVSGINEEINEITPSDSTDDTEDLFDNEQINKLVEKLTPAIKKIFPTKKDIADVLKGAESDNIEVDELVELLERQIGLLKRKKAGATV